MHSSYRLFLTPYAIDDIEECTARIAEVSQDQPIADEWKNSILRHIEILRDFPESYPKYQIARYRRVLHGNYLIIYRIDKDSLTVVVCRILHTSRLIENSGEIE
jgi:plasmid stabilization system protein ParE